MTDTTVPEFPDLRQVGVRGRVYERVVEEIRGYVEAHKLQPGHKLPSERILIEQLGVSRSSVREALKVLAALGLIRINHGDGVYVAASSAASSDAWDPNSRPWFDATEEHALRSLVEIRLGIEVAAASAAAMRVTDEDLDHLEQMLDSHEAQLTSNPDFVWEPLGFELALIEITGNTWMYEIEVQLRDTWLSLSSGLRTSVARYHEWLAEHRAILASIRSRNVTQVQRLVLAHVSLERFEEDLASRNNVAGPPVRK